MNTASIHAGPSLAEILTMTEASELTRLPMSTLRYYRHTGQGPKSFLIARRVVYMKSDVLDWIQAQYAESAR